MLALPGLAHAATYCVNASGCTGTSEPDLQTALNAAAATTSVADTVHVGNPGVPTGSGWTYSDGGHAANQVDIIGAGPSSTLLTDTGNPVLNVQGPGSTISDLTVQLPQAGASGIATSGSLSNVYVTSLDGGSHTQTGVSLSGTGGQHWTGGGISLPTTGSDFAIVRSAAPETVDLEDLTIATAAIALFPMPGDDVTVRRSSIESAIAAVNLGGHLTLDNVAFHGLVAPGPVPFVGTLPSGSFDAITDLNHISAYGTNTSGTIGALDVHDSSGDSATVNVRNSIFRNFAESISRSATTSGGSANVNVSYSDMDLIHTINTPNTNGATGDINIGSGMIDADPLFTNPTGGDFSLKAGSPALDAGDPAGLLPGDSATDVLGAPRISNGRQDMGAVEFQVIPPPAPPAPPAPLAPPAKDRLAPKLKLSKLPKSVKLKQLLKGLKFTVTTSEPSSVNATLAGAVRSVNLARHFDYTLAHKHLGQKSGKRRITLKVRRRVLGHSRRFTLRLTVVATDASGNKTTVRRTIKVR